jgi:hypothetical protein
VTDRPCDHGLREPVRRGGAGQENRTVRSLEHTAKSMSRVRMAHNSPGRNGENPAANVQNVRADSPAVLATTSANTAQSSRGNS